MRSGQGESPSRDNSNVMEFSFFDSFLSVLAVVVLAVVICKSLQIPSILGYLAVGIIVGPNVIGLIPESARISHLAEFGIVFLMFTIGLEFSLSRMLKMKHLVIGLGGAQVLLTVLITTAFGLLLSLGWHQALVIGCIVSLSSTAIASKQLTDQNELNAPHSQNAISILLFQDLAVIPFFILISSFSSTTISLSTALLYALGKAVLAMLLILGVGLQLLRPLFRRIAATHSLELFTLSVLLVTVAAAWLTEYLGLSLALGAFMAGMMLGETEFRHQIEATVRPFRDLLLGLFFITIGMLLNINSIDETWHWILLLFLALTGLKLLIITVLSYFAVRNLKISVRTGLVLAQGGEFGFALLTLALQDNILSQTYGQAVLGALLLSMATAPIVIYFNKMIANFVVPKSWHTWVDIPDTGAEQFTHKLKDHVILCGFGRNGQNIAKLLDGEQVPFIGIDNNHKLVNNCASMGYPVIYGDASLYEILEACKLNYAKAVVISCDHSLTIEKILQQIRAHHKNLPIFVRTQDDSDFERLQAMGATEVIPASLETSLTLTSHLLLTMGVSHHRIVELMTRVRKTRYRMLRTVLSGLQIPR
ncbi:MAG: cation:proton antiporter [Pseudomonadota bacterium]|nr:cation:proton antiporter [Pseudomonadota bacterium]